LRSKFDKVIEQLKLEHQVELENLRSDLDTVRRVMKTEDRLGSVMSPSKQSVPRPPQDRALPRSGNRGEDLFLCAV
jgi:hypothetical protein